MAMKIGREAHPDPVENYFEESHRLGFNWLELGCESPANFPQTFDEERIRKVRDLGRKYGISTCLHSASYVNTAELMPTVRKAVEQHFVEYLELAKKMECTYLVIHCGYHFSQFMEATFESLVSTLKNAVKVAEKLKVSMLIENMNRLHPDCEINYLGTTVEELKFVLDRIQTPYLGLAMDCGHANLLPGGVMPFIEAFGPRIQGLHLHDNDMVLDRHWPLGKGKIDWPMVFRKLKEMGYQGTHTIELDRHEDVVASQKYLQSIGVL